MTELAFLAEEVQANERTLRRAANRGTIRCNREGPRKISLPRGEYDYLRTCWPLLARLVGVLRTLPAVRLAVLYGSLARGEGRSDSDVDLLVRFRDDTIRARALALADPTPQRRRVSGQAHFVSGARESLIENGADRRVIVGDEYTTCGHCYSSS